MKLSVSPKPKALHILLYGPPKIGKSALAGEMAEHGYKLIWFDLENGSSVLYSRLSDTAKENVELIRIPDTPGWPVAIETMMKVLKRITDRNAKFRICETHGKMDCPLCARDSKAQWTSIDLSQYDPATTIFVGDSITQLSKSSMNQISKDQDVDSFKPGWDEFGKQGQHLDYVLGYVQNCPWHWIWISHEQVIEQISGNDKHAVSGKTEKLYPVGGTRNYSRTVPKFFDDVIYMRLYNKRHTAVSETTELPEVLAGSRNGLELSKIKEQDKLTLLSAFEGTTGIIQQTQQATEILNTVKGVSADAKEQK